MGVFQGKVTRIEPDGDVWAEISDLAIDQEFPCRWVGTGLSVGDFVLVVNIDGAQEDLVVIGSLNDGQVTTTTYKIGEDVDGVPFYTLGDGDIKLDADGVPYYTI